MMGGVVWIRESVLDPRRWPYLSGDECWVGWSHGSLVRIGRIEGERCYDLGELVDLAPRPPLRRDLRALGVEID